MIMVTSGVLLLLLISQLQFRVGEEQYLISYTSSGLVAYLIWLPIGIAIFAKYQPTTLQNIAIGQFVTITLCASLLFAWITYDAYKLSCKMSPDEYMKGVIHFYTDMFYMCACCCLITCMGGSRG